MHLLRVQMPQDTAPLTETPAGEWRRLPPMARRAFEVGAAAGAALTGALIVAVVFMLCVVYGWAFPVRSCAALWVLWVIGGFFRGRLRWAHTGWCLDNALRIRRGRWWHSESIVPRIRIQHLNLSRGPIERRFGLATLTVYTAGTSLSAVALSGLDDASAVALRDSLLPEEADGEGDGI